MKRRHVGLVVAWSTAGLLGGCAELGAPDTQSVGAGIRPTDPGHRKDAQTDAPTDAADAGVDAGIDAADAAMDAASDAGADAADDVTTGPTDYYVATTGRDTNPGTAGAPFATYQHAMGLARPGDRVLVRAGVYPGGGYITTQGSEAQPIQVLSVDGPRRAVIEGGNEGLRVGGGAAFLVFDGFEVRLANDDLVHVDGQSHHIWLRNLYAHDAGTNGDVVKVNQCDHIFVEGCELARPGRRLHDVNPYQECLDMLDVDDSAVRDSFLHDAGSIGITVKGGSRDAVIERNVFADQRAGASDPLVALGGSTDTALLLGESYEVINVVFRNNIVQNSTTGAIGIYDGQGVYVADNLFVDNNRVLVEFRAGNGPLHQSATVRVSGNLFVDNRGSMPVPFLQSSDGLTDFATASNLYWNHGAAIPSSPLIDMTTQPGYLVGDPGVASATGSAAARIAAMRPNASGPAAGSGLDLSAAPFFVTDDIVQVLRGTALDRGPYLLTSVPQ